MTRLLTLPAHRDIPSAVLKTAKTHLALQPLLMFTDFVDLLFYAFMDYCNVPMFIL